MILLLQLLLEKDNENEIKVLTLFKPFYPELIKEAITEAIANIQSVTSLDSEEAYIAEIEAIFKPFIEDQELYWVI